MAKRAGSLALDRERKCKTIIPKTSALSPADLSSTGRGDNIQCGRVRRLIVKGLIDFANEQGYKPALSRHQNFYPI